MMKRLAAIYLFSFWVLFHSFNFASHAKTTGIIAGIVTDKISGKPIRSARVRTGLAAVHTDSRGAYIMTLPAGVHDLSISKDYYTPMLVSNMLVAADQTTTLNITLAPTGQWQMFGGGMERTRRATLESDLGAPGIAWRYPIKPKNPQIQMIEDVNNDGVKEILAIHAERLYAFRGDGTLLWETRGGIGNEIGAIIGIHDLDGNGIWDIVAGNQTAEDSSGLYRAARLIVLNGNDGSVQYCYDFIDEGKGHCGTTGFGTANSINRYNTRIVNVDDDPELEIISLPDFLYEFKLFDFSEGVPKGRVVYSQDYYPRNGGQGMAVGDVDNDSRLEIVLDWYGTLYVHDAASGAPKYQYAGFDSGESSGATILTDVDGDFAPEIIKISATAQSITVFDGSTSGIVVKWQKDNIGDLFFPHNAVADVDGDNALEIMIGVRGDGMYVYHAADGSLKAFLPARFPKAVRDVDGDGLPEILAGTAATQPNPSICKQRNNQLTEITNLSGHNWVYGTESFPSHAGENYSFVNSVPTLEYLGSNILTQSKGVLYSHRATTETLILEWQYAYSPASPERNARVAVGDVDGDSLDEVILFVDDGTLRILNERGVEQVSVPTYFGGLCVPHVVDLNNDGKNEIIAMDFPAALNRPDYYVGEMKILDASHASPSVPPAELGWSYKGAYLDLHIRQYWTPVFDDLDGDGLQEIIFFSDGSAVRVLNYDGATKWTYNFNAVYLGTGYFNADSIRDVFAATIDHDFRILDGRDGSLIWSGKKPSRWIPSVANVNEDGIDDIVALGENNYIYAYDGSNGALLWGDNSNCALCNNGTVAVGDLDGDGIPELVSSGNFGVAAYKRDGKILWEQKIVNTEGFKHLFSALSDLDGDGALDVVQPGNHGLYAFNGRDGSEIWRYYSNGGVSVTSVAAGDLDGDGRDEILFGSNDGYLRALNGEDGSLSWGIYLGCQMSEPVLADVDNDGELEILITANGYLYGLDKNHTPISGLYMNTRNILCYDGTIAYAVYPTTATASVDMSLATTANTMYIEIGDWRDSPAFVRRWTESTAASSAMTTHTLGQLKPWHFYQLMVDGKDERIYQTDENGRLRFTYYGGAAQKVFEIRETIVTLSALVLY